MIFSQVEYLAFFAAVFFSYWAAPRRARIWVLLFASLGFYGTWNWRYLALILGSSAVDHVAAHRIAASEDTRVRNRWLLGSLVANLGSLAVFKYADFFLQSAAGLVEALGFHASIPTLNLLLPVGISFYTFQSMSYTIDVWRRQRAPEPSAVHFVTYVAFFPQLVAGPIVRVGELMDQLHALPPLTVEKARRGGRLFLWGLVKKAVFADLVAVKCVDVVFADPAAYDTASVWLAALGYSLQIYADFSGYTDMARGSALALGFELPENFRTPYRSRDITEFWRRWHISLSSWLRDYLYISLGGNRGGPGKTYRNLMLTMLLGGLWHGSAWTFVIWGALHGGALGLHRGWKARFEGAPFRRTLAWQAVAGLSTFLFVCVTFVLFRAQSFSDFGWMVARMVVPSGGATALHVGAVALVATFAVGTLVGARLDVERLAARTPWPVRSVIYAGAVLAVLMLSPNTTVPFVYFQF